MEFYLGIISGPCEGLYGVMQEWYKGYTARDQLPLIMNPPVRGGGLFCQKRRGGQAIFQSYRVK